MQATNLHFRVQNISRRGGKNALASAAYRSGSRVGTRSVVAAASYRSGERLHDARLSQTFDFRRKEDVRFTAIHGPDYRPAWALHRGDLWNSVEETEKRKDARLAKDIVAALPRELTLAQQISLIDEFVEQEFVSRALIADVAIHNKRASDGRDNPHVHIMITTRPVTEDGFGQKDRMLDKQEMLESWRTSFEALCNRYLEEANRSQRVSLQSYETRGINRKPGEHLGPEQWAFEQRGEATTRGNRNRDRRRDNRIEEMRESWDPVLHPQDEDPAPMHEQEGKQDHKTPKHAALSEAESQASHLAQIADESKPNDGDAAARFRALDEVAQRQDNATSGHRSNLPGDAAIEARKRTLARSLASRTVHHVVAFTSRIAHYTRKKAEELWQDEQSGSQPSTLYDNIRQVAASVRARTDKDRQEQDHER